jgi:hypothetical protein
MMAAIKKSYGYDRNYLGHNNRALDINLAFILD